MTATLDFWFDFASTYSYIAAARVESEAARAGVAVNWRAFLLGPIFAAKGWNDSPFNLDPAKGAYMWRDMERLAAKYGLAFQRTSDFPRRSVEAGRIAAAFAGEPWLPGYVRAVFHANFAEDRPIDDADALQAFVDAAGGPSDAAARAQETPLKDALRAATEDARAKGLFGAPSFTVGAELFWGSDRLADALAHAASVD